MVPAPAASIARRWRGLSSLSGVNRVVMRFIACFFKVQHRGHGAHREGVIFFSLLCVLCVLRVLCAGFSLIEFFGDEHRRAGQ